MYILVHENTVMVDICHEALRSIWAPDFSKVKGPQYDPWAHIENKKLSELKKIVLKNFIGFMYNSMYFVYHLFKSLSH